MSLAAARRRRRMARGGERSGFDILVDCAVDLLKIAEAKQRWNKRRAAIASRANAAAIKTWARQFRSWKGASQAPVRRAPRS